MNKNVLRWIEDELPNMSQTFTTDCMREAIYEKRGSAYCSTNRVLGYALKFYCVKVGNKQWRKKALLEAKA